MVRPIERFVAGRSRSEAGEFHVLALLAHADVRWRPSLPGIRSGSERGVQSPAGVSLPLGLGSVSGSRGRIPGDFGRWRWGGELLHERDPPGSAAKTCRCRGIPCHPQEAEQARSGLQKESRHNRWGLCAARFTLRSLSETPYAVLCPGVRFPACAMKRSGSFTRSSPEMSLGRRASRRAVSSDDSELAIGCRCHETRNSSTKAL